MRQKEEDTALRISRRKYEEKNKDKRRNENANFQTMIPREDYDKMNQFLKEHHLTKVDLIFAGYRALMLDNDSKKENN